MYNDLLVVGGDFDGYIMTWNGLAWNSLPGNVDSSVWTLAAAPPTPAWPAWKYVAVIVPVAAFVLVATVAAVVYVLVRERNLKKRAHGAASGSAPGSGPGSAPGSAPGTTFAGSLDGSTEPLLAPSTGVTIQSQ